MLIYKITTIINGHDMKNYIIKLSILYILEYNKYGSWTK